VFAQRRHPFWTEVAKIRRGARLSTRPKFGVEGGERDFVVVELQRRSRPLLRGESDTEQWEWWL
jgi:hypothetical protein